MKLKLSYLILLFSLLGAPSFAAPMVLLTDPGNNLEIATTLEDNVPVERVSEALLSIPDGSDREIIVATDNPAVVERVIEWSKDHPNNKTPKFIFLGKLLSINPANKIANQYTTYKKFVAEKYVKDRTNFWYAVVNFGVESAFWIAATGGSLEQKAAIITFAAFITGTIGLDKDFWTKNISGPTERAIFGFLTKAKIAKGDEDINSLTRISTRLFSNLTLSLGMQALRLSVFSFDEIHTAVMEPKFWITTGALAVAITASTFGWSEALASIDQEKYPKTKNTLRRFTEIRSTVMGFLSPSAHVLQPDAYGIRPYLYLIANGAVGLALMLKSDKIKDWYESRSLLGMLNKGVFNVIAFGTSKKIFWKLQNLEIAEKYEQMHEKLQWAKKYEDLNMSSRVEHGFEKLNYKAALSSDRILGFVKRCEDIYRN